MLDFKTHYNSCEKEVSELLCTSIKTTAVNSTTQLRNRIFRLLCVAKVPPAPLLGIKTYRLPVQLPFIKSCRRMSQAKRLKPCEGGGPHSLRLPRLEVDNQLQELASEHLHIRKLSDRWMCSSSSSSSTPSPYPFLHRLPAA